MKMLLSETGFTFGGVHSRDDMGLIYAEKDGHIAIPEIKRNAYSIAGMSGTVLMPGEAWQTFFLEGTLYPAEEPRTQAEAQVLLRNITAWLTAGRQQLIFDYEPEVYYLAELSTQSKWSLRNWFGGELPIRFTVQPFAYNIEETSATATITGTSTSLTLNMKTGQPAPLKLVIENQNYAAITRVTVGSDIRLTGFSLPVGGTLEIDMEPPVGAVMRIGANVENALPFATMFKPRMLNSGQNYVTVSLTYDSTSNRGAKITASARGRW